MGYAILVGALAALAAPQQTDTTFAVRPGGRLRIENQRGSVVVRTWDRNEMRVRANAPDGVRLEIDRSGRGASTVQIETRLRGAPRPIDYEITVPRQFDVDIEGVMVSIEVIDVQGAVNAETVDGAVTIRGVNGRIDVESLQGQIAVHDSRGSLAAQATNQGITVSSFAGNLSLACINGSLALTDITAERVEAETINGKVEYSGTLQDRGSYELSTHNGEVILHVPEGTNATVAAVTHMGEIESAFPVRLRERVGRSRATFTIGAGRGARIELASFAGPIRIRRAPAR
jgi:DUF4097 and DUF4098 domain-containing protein YvlB